VSFDEFINDLPVPFLVAVLHKAVLLHDFELAHPEFLLKLRPKLIPVSHIPALHSVKISAVFGAQFRQLCHVMLLGQVQLILEVVDVALEVEPNFLHALLQGRHFLRLVLDDFTLLETHQGFHYLIRLHPSSLRRFLAVVDFSCWILSAWRFILNNLSCFDR